MAPVSEADMLIVHVVAPKAEAEPVAAEAAAAARRRPAEPEVIKKGKAEKEDDKDEARGTSRPEPWAGASLRLREARRRSWQSGR